MNRLLTTIPGARGRGPVRVERKIRRRSAEELRGAGVTAVGDALFRMGGPLSGRDVLRILTKTKGEQGKTKVPTKGTGELLTRGDGKLSTELPTQAAALSGALAADVCRHIWAERGRFAPILYGSA